MMQLLRKKPCSYVLKTAAVRSFFQSFSNILNLLPVPQKVVFEKKDNVIFFCRWRKWSRNIQNLFVCLFRLWPDTQQQHSLLRQPLISYSQPPAASFIVLAHLSVWMCSEPVTGNDSDEKSCSIFRSRAVLVKVDIKWQPCHDTWGRWIFFN